MEEIILDMIEFNNSVLNCVTLSRSDICSKLQKLKDRSFNYFLIIEDEIQYIGYTSSIYLRFRQHKLYYEFDKILLIEFNSPQSARNQERDFIKIFKPKHNTQYLN